MSHDHAADGPLLRLREAARLLRLSYERLRVLANQGRLKTEYVTGVGRVVRASELERFRNLPRRIGRSLIPKPAARSAGSRAVLGIEDLLDRVADQTGHRFSSHQRRNLVRLGLLQARREFPRGLRGRQAWLACQYRRLIGIARCLDGRAVEDRDLIIALKLRGYRIRHELLTVAMLCYLWPLAEGLTAWREGEADGFAVDAARRPSPYPGVREMSRDQRAGVYEAMLRIASGDPFTPTDMRRAVEGIGVPYDLLPRHDDPAQEPDLSWFGLFSTGRTTIEKVVALVQSSVTQREDGRHEFRPFCTAKEMDQAWTAARGSLDLVWPLISHPSVPTRVLMATIVQAVMNCLVITREQGENAFLPIEQLKAAMRDLIGQYPAEVAEMLESHPELSQLLGSDHVTKTGPSGGGGAV